MTSWSARYANYVRRGTWQDNAKTWDGCPCELFPCTLRGLVGWSLVRPSSKSGYHSKNLVGLRSEPARTLLEPGYKVTTRVEAAWKPVGTLSDQSRNMAGNLLNPLEIRSKPFFPRRTSEPSWNRCRTGRETRQRPTYPFSHDSMECSALSPGAISITLGSNSLLTEFQPIPSYENLKPRDRFSRSEPGPWLF